MEYSIIPKLDNLELQQLATKSVLELSYKIELCDEEIYQIKVNSLFLLSVIKVWLLFVKRSYYEKK